MPAKLTTTIKNIDSVPDLTNTAIVKQFHQFMKENGASERHQNNNLKTVLTSGITLPSMPFIFLFPLPFFVCRFVVVVIVVYVFIITTKIPFNHPSDIPALGNIATPLADLLYYYASWQ